MEQFVHGAGLPLHKERLPKTQAKQLKITIKSKKNKPARQDHEPAETYIRPLRGQDDEIDKTTNSDFDNTTMDADKVAMLTGDSRSGSPYTSQQPYPLQPVGAPGLYGKFSRVKEQGADSLDNDFEQMQRERMGNNKYSRSVEEEEEEEEEEEDDEEYQEPHSDPDIDEHNIDDSLTRQSPTPHMAKDSYHRAELNSRYNYQHSPAPNSGLQAMKRAPNATHPGHTAIPIRHHMVAPHIHGDVHRHHTAQQVRSDSIDRRRDDNITYNGKSAIYTQPSKVHSRTSIANIETDSPHDSLESALFNQNGKRLRQTRNPQTPSLTHKYQQSNLEASRNNMKVTKSPQEYHIDYSQEDLAKMAYTELEKEPFDHDPNVPHESKVMGGDLAKQLAKGRSLSTLDQQHLFNGLSIEAWEEAGDWFLDQFSEIMGKMRKARQDKRKLALEFENEVAIRQKAIEVCENGITKALGEMKNSGKGILKAESVSKANKDSENDA